MTTHSKYYLKMITTLIFSFSILEIISFIYFKEFIQTIHALGVFSLLFVIYLIRNMLIHQIKQIEILETQRKLYLDKISHEIKTPLHETLSVMKMLIESRVPEEDKIARMIAVRSAMSQIEYMIVQLQKSKEIIEQDIQLRPSSIHLPTIIKTVCDAFDIPQHIELETLIDDDYFYIDEIAFQQILFNLLSNALKYADNFVQIMCIVDIQGDLALAVANQTTWIPDNDFPSLFEIYQRDSAHARIHGTGIGLTIITGLVNAMRGELELEHLKDWGVVALCRIPSHEN